MITSRLTSMRVMELSNHKMRKKTYRQTKRRGILNTKSGAKFGIRITFGEAFGTEYGVRMEVRIDGLAARKIILGPADLHAHGGQYVCSYKHEYRNLKRYRRDFQFADLEVGEYTLSSALTRAQSCRGDVRRRYTFKPSRQHWSGRKHFCHSPQNRKRASAASNIANEKLVPP